MKTDLDRRNFLGKCRALPAAYLASRTAGFSLLGASSIALSAQCQDDARSLVCVFLAGGADSFNMLIPGGSRYNDYRNTRQDLAVDENNLLEASDARHGSIAFNRALPLFHSLYQSGNLAMVSNVGPLIQPTTREDFQSERLLPESLFAHNTQQKLWQTAAARVSGAASVGWGGALGQPLTTCNTGAQIPGSISVAGSNSFLTTRSAPYLALSPGGNIKRMFGVDADTASWIPKSSREATSGLLSLLMDQADQTESPVMLREASAVVRRAQIATSRLQDALAQFTQSDWQPGLHNKLEHQLHLVTRLIQARETLGLNRQVFFVSMGGWDTHSNQNERMPSLFSELDTALSNFQQALHAAGLEDSVTTFTASDFGRTLTSNGNGTDHGWGGHAFVFGGSVNGGQIYGQLPSYASVDNPDDIGDDHGQFAGRLIPTTSVNQYGATLARWMGLTETEITEIFPDLANFSQADLGFL